MVSLRLRVAFGAAIFAALASCTPKIGDSCVTSLDCSQLGDRLCDSSQPEGYCTVFNCEPDTCPDNTLCIAFGQELDPTCANYDPRWARFERSFCMAPCEADSDCRTGYECRSPSERRSAQIDTDPNLLGRKACYPASAAPPDAVGNADSCNPPGVSTSAATSSASDSSSSSSSASSGAGGASSSSGSGSSSGAGGASSSSSAGGAGSSSSGG